MFRDFPEMPEFSAELLADCERRGDPMPLLFEWFKLIGVLAINVGSIAPETTGYLVRPKAHRAVASGLACRCGRLMYSIAKLSTNGLGGETSAILGRCIAESALVLEWRTSSDGATDKFQRYLADGLKTDIQLEDEIHASIAARGGDVLAIERRMLDSIARSRADAGMDRPEIEGTKKLPDVKSMMEMLGRSDRHYLGVQRMMSQFVHGTWTDLRSHYLKKNECGDFTLKDIDDAPLKANILWLTSLLVTDALESLFGYMVGDKTLRDQFGLYLMEIRDGVAWADSLGSRGDNDVCA